MGNAGNRNRVTNCDTLAASLRSAHDAGQSWRDLAKEFRVKPGTLCRIAKHGYEPKKAAIRAALGLPTLAPAPVCPRHGIVHTRACRAARAPRRLFDWPTKALARAIRERS